MYSLTFGSFLWSAPVQDETAHHCFLYFIKLFYIFRALDCDQNATIFWECASKNVVTLVRVHGLRCSKAGALPAVAHCSRRKISLIRCKCFSRAWFHTARVSRAEAAQKRRVCRAGAAHAHCAFTRSFSTSAKVRAADGTQWRIWFSN